MTELKKSLLTFVLLFLGANFAISAGINFQDLTLKEALNKAKTENKKVFIDVYATWCGPCKYLSRSVFVDKELGEFMNEHFISIKLDGEKGDGPGVMVDYALDSYPTMLFFSPEQELLKKIVGAVGAEEILAGGNAIVFPESTEIFKMTAKYEGGNRDKEFLQEFIETSLNEDLDTEPLVEEYLTLFPDLSLEDENEFLIFCLGIDELENKFTKEFLAETAKYYELHPELAEAKMKMLLVGLTETAQEENDPSIIKDGVPALFDSFTEIFGDDFTIPELVDALMEIYGEE